MLIDVGKRFGEEERDPIWSAFYVFSSLVSAAMDCHPQRLDALDRELLPHARTGIALIYIDNGTFILTGPRENYER